MQVRRAHQRRRVTVFVLIGLLVMGCAPGIQTPAAPETGVRTGPKVLRVGMRSGNEPVSGIALGATGIGGAEHTYTFHSGLTVFDAQGVLTPSVAEKAPSVEDGDWKLFPDGRMEVTWKLRPDVKWHDGSPATAADFALGIKMRQDRELTFGASRAASLISEVSTPDGHTLVIGWKQPYTAANASGPTDLPAVPEHLLSAAYGRGDKQAVINSPYWTTEFVGLGPYRLGAWTRGSHLEALAFDDYFLGRPAIERITFHYIGDANVLHLNLLAGEVDVVSFGNFQADSYILLKQGWDPTGAGTTLAVFSGTRNYKFQFRDLEAPWARDVRVRRALIQMIDRQALADTLMAGLSTPADTAVAPGDPIYRLIEQRGLPKYPFDLAQAQRLMADAGWPRAQDGSYRGADGEPLTLDVWTIPHVANLQEVEAVSGHWRAAGVGTKTVLVPDTAANLNEMRHTYSGVWGTPLRDTHESLAAFITSQMGTPANRWSGANRGGYSNPTFDRLYDESIVTLDVNRRQGLIADLWKLEAEDATSIHMFYDMAQQVIAFRKGVRGPGVVPPVQLATHWNVHRWDVD